LFVRRWARRNSLANAFWSCRCQDLGADRSGRGPPGGFLSAMTAPLLVAKAAHNRQKGEQRHARRPWPQRRSARAAPLRAAGRTMTYRRGGSAHAAWRIYAEPPQPHERGCRRPPFRRARLDHFVPRLTAGGRRYGPCVPPARELVLSGCNGIGGPSRMSHVAGTDGSSPPSPSGESATNCSGVGL
jgi:hypothetical protein